MRSVILISLLIVTFCGCKTTENSVGNEDASMNSVVNEYALMVKFVSDEGFKRAMFEFERLRMKVDQDVLVEDHIYQILIQCKEYEIDGIVQKLNNNPNIDWAKRSQ
jgi:hypothetical protein